ncbi:MAG: helix-turn-helix domain-containing protein [Bacteriovoracaceae bacterium]
MADQELNQADDNNSTNSLLGDFLKQKRLDKNYSLEKLSQKTKISVNILKSIEANDYEHLPSAAYIKGFVSSYARVVGATIPEVIEKMEYTYLTVLGKPFPALNHTKNMAPQSPANPQSEEVSSPHEVIESGDSIIESTKSLLPLIIFSVVILTIVGGYKIISSVVESEVNEQKTKDLGPKIESSSALVKPVVKPEAPSEKTDSTGDATKATVEEKKEEKLTDFQRNFPHIDFRPAKSNLFTIKTDAPENTDSNILPDKIKSSVNSDLQNIYITAIDGNTWVSYKIDNNPITSVIINKGSDLLLQGGEIRLFLGNVAVTRIFYNNYLIETPTKNGVKSLIFPEESSSKYLMPLFPKAKDDILYTAEDYIKRMKLEEEEIKKREQQPQ